jgi:hypothetical protein
VCSHNGKRGLVGNVRIATKRRRRHSSNHVSLWTLLECGYIHVSLENKLSTCLLDDSTHALMGL